MSKQKRIIFQEVAKDVTVNLHVTNEYGASNEIPHIIEGTPIEVLNGILNKLKEMGFTVEEKTLRIFPPKESVPDKDEFQNNFERDSFEQFFKDCPLDQRDWGDGVRRKLALWIHLHIQALVKSSKE